MLVVSRLIPNPLTRTSSLRLGLPTQASVEVVLFDVQGRLVRKLVTGELAAGFHELRWDGEDGNRNRVGAGVYFCSISVNGKKVVRRAVVVR